MTTTRSLEIGKQSSSNKSVISHDLLGADDHGFWVPRKFANSARPGGAGKGAAEILNRGPAGRNCCNILVFLTADKTPFVDLDKAVRFYLACESVRETAARN
jgi:hypothetical protein